MQSLIIIYHFPSQHTTSERRCMDVVLTFCGFNFANGQKLDKEMTIFNYSNLNLYIFQVIHFNFADGSFERFRVDLILRIVISRYLLSQKMAKNREFAKSNPAVFNPIKAYMIFFTVL